MKTVGQVDSLWRYPVKSMRGEQLQEAFLGFAGVYGDRLYAFRRASGPKPSPFLTATKLAEMLLYRPVYRYPEHMVRPGNLADAESIPPGLTPLYADSAERVLDVETPLGKLLAMDDPQLISALQECIGEDDRLTLMRSDRAMTDCRPISLFSIQTAQELSSDLGFELDKRRFRANIYADLASADGFAEDKFVGCMLQIGSKAVIAVIDRDPRCKMITLDPVTGEANPEVMKLVAKAHEGNAGVYGAVVVEGVIRPGDAISVLN